MGWQRRVTIKTCSRRFVCAQWISNENKYCRWSRISVCKYAELRTQSVPSVLNILQWVRWCVLPVWSDAVASLLHIEAEIKWQPFSRRHFEMHFLEWKCMNFAYDFTEVFPKDLINNMRWSGDKPLSEPMMLIYWRKYVSLGLNELINDSTAFKWSCTAIG